MKYTHCEHCDRKLYAGTQTVTDKHGRVFCGFECAVLFHEGTDRGIYSRELLSGYLDDSEWYEEKEENTMKAEFNTNHEVTMGEITMNKQDILAFADLYRKFQKRCKHIEEILYLEPVKVHQCEKCNCEFSYRCLKDVIVVDERVSFYETETYRYLKCPECGHRNYIDKSTEK